MLLSEIIIFLLFPVLFLAWTSMGPHSSLICHSLHCWFVFTFHLLLDFILKSIYQCAVNAGKQLKVGNERTNKHFLILFYHLKNWSEIKWNVVSFIISKAVVFGTHRHIRQELKKFQSAIYDRAMKSCLEHTIFIFHSHVCVTSVSGLRYILCIPSLRSLT